MTTESVEEAESSAQAMRSIIEAALAMLRVERVQEAELLLSSEVGEEPEDVVSACAVRAMRQMTEEFPEPRTVADCQALLGALTLAVAMGVPQELLDPVATAEGLGRELALAQQAERVGQEVSRRLASLEGCPEMLPCPGCGSAVSRPEPDAYVSCLGCGTRAVLTIKFDGDSEAFTYKLLKTGKARA